MNTTLIYTQSIAKNTASQPTSDMEMQQVENGVLPVELQHFQTQDSRCSAFAPLETSLPAAQSTAQPSNARLPELEVDLDATIGDSFRIRGNSNAQIESPSTERPETLTNSISKESTIVKRPEIASDRPPEDD